MKKAAILILISIILTACSPANTGPNEATVASMVQQEVSRMQTAMPTETTAVMATNTPIPPTPGAPPAETLFPDDQTQAEKSNGTWLVGSEIAVGKWVSRGFSNCMGFLLDSNGNPIDTQMGPEAILFVTSQGHSVMFTNPVCKWTYLPE